MTETVTRYPVEFNLLYRKRPILHPVVAIIKHNLVLTNGSFISSLTASASYRAIADISTRRNCEAERWRRRRREANSSLTLTVSLAISVAPSMILRPSDPLPLLLNLTTRINGWARNSRSNCFELLWISRFFSNAIMVERVYIYIEKIYLYDYGEGDRNVFNYILLIRRNINSVLSRVHFFLSPSFYLIISRLGLGVLHGT